MSSGDFNLLHLRNLKMYKPDGAYPTVSSIFTIGSNGVPVYTNEIALNSVSASTLTTSTLVASTATMSTLSVSAQLGFSTMLGSTATLSTANISTLNANSLVFSTMVGSTANLSTATMSTLGVSAQLSFSTMVGSSLVASTATMSTLGVSAQLSFSTMAGSTANLSTATMSTLSVTSQLSVSSLVASTISTNLLTTSDIQLQSTAIALGLSTTSTQTNFSQGSYAPTSWALAKSGITNARKLAMSSTGQYQVVVSEATGNLWLSSDSGVTWSALGASQGLPVLEGSASWSAGSISSTGKDIMLAVCGGSLWFSTDYGRTFSTSAQATPDIWLPLDGSTSDVMGSSTVTATGSPGYVAFGQPGFTDKAIRLVNTAGSLTPSQYVRGTWSGSSSGNFTVSFWFNAQSVGGYSYLFSTYSTFAIALDPSGIIYLYTVSPSGPAIQVSTTSSISVNTWYYLTASFSSNSTGSLYINNQLIGTYNCGASPGASTGLFSIGCADAVVSNAFNGSIADFKIHNSAISYVPIPHVAPAYWLPFEGSAADAGSYSTVSVATPHIYLPFEGSTADAQGHSTVTSYGSPSYVPSGAKGAAGSQAIQLSNTAGGTATQYVRGTVSTSSMYTISGWINVQSFASSCVAVSLGSTTETAFQLLIGLNGEINVEFRTSGGSWSYITGPSISLNTWYEFTIIYQLSGICSFYLNKSLIGTIAGMALFSIITTFDLGRALYGGTAYSAFNGLIDDFKIYNTAFVQTPSPVPEPTIYLPLEGSVADQQGFSTVTTSPTVPAYTTSVRSGALGLQAINLVNTAGGTADQYVRGTWAGSANSTISFWFNAQTLNGSYQTIFSTYNASLAAVISNENKLYVVVPTGGGTARSIVGTSGVLSINTWYYATLIFQTGGSCSFYLNNSLVGTLTNTQGVGTLTTSVFELSGEDGTQNFAFNGYIDDFKIYNYAVSLNHPSIYLPFEGSVADAMGGSAVSTSPSVPGYTASVPLGSTGIRSLNLVNTAGGTADQYVSGIVSLSSAFTISCWINVQSFPSSGTQSCVISFGNSANSSVFVLIVPSSGTLQPGFQISGGSYVNIGTGTTIALNTWYYVNVIYQSSGTCSYYLNNTLVGTVSGQPLNNGPTVSFHLARLAESITQGFNGYINDLRIWNTAVPYVPVSIVQPTGSLSYVPGVVGQTAVNLVNTAGGTADNYIRGGWSGASNFTVSFWFNSQTIPSSQQYVLFGTYNNTFNIYVYTTGQLAWYVPNGGGSWGINLVTSYSLSQNVWYHIYAIFQSGGVCSLFINGVNTLSFTNSGGVGTLTTKEFSLGTFDMYTTQAFNGYIDDFRLYNAAIPYSSLFPANYTHLAMAGNGAYRMAAHQLGSQCGRLLLSSDSGSTWALQSAAATPGAWSSLSASNSGQYLTAQSQPVVQPNQSGLTAATWSQQGVTYTASASSVYGLPGYEAQYAFNNYYGSVNPYSWAGSPSTGYYDSTGSYVGTGNVSTVIQSVGTVAGEWLQLRTSMPMVLQSYRYACGGYTNLPRLYYIVGSNDGSTWYPLQYVSMAANPLTANFTIISSDVVMNYTGTQMVQGAITATGVTTAYSYTVQPFQYFRMVVNKTWAGPSGGIAEINELYLNFVGGCIMPNQSGLVASTWSQSGVSWAVSASSTYNANFPSYKAFDNTIANNNRWVSGIASENLYNSTTGIYSGTTNTTIQTIGATGGEWLQLQSSMPMILQSYSYWSGGIASRRMPKQYYIVGSNDGSVWYPLQYVNMTTPPLTTDDTKASTYIIMNYTGTQTIQGNQTGSGTTTAYAPYVTQAFQYFRIIVTSLYVNNDSFVDLAEFLPIFSAGQNSSTNYGLTWTPTLQTGDAFNVTKNLTVTSAGTGWAQLPAFTPVAAGVTISAWFTLQSAPGAAARLFDASTSNVGTTNSVIIYFDINSRIVILQRINGVDTPTVSSTTPVSIGIQYHFVWTIDGLGNHRTYINGVQDITSSGSINVITYSYVNIGKSNDNSPYPNMTVRDFRMFNRALNAAEVSALYANVNYGQPAVGPLALSDSGEYALAAFDRCAEVGSGYLSGVQSSRWSNPRLSGISGPIVDTAVSQTGREMVLVTAGPQNNVYYSTDYGATFSGLTLGTSSLASNQTPLARLTLDNTNVDSRGALTPTAGAGTVTYSSSVYTVGTHSAYFANTAGALPSVYLNYTVPVALNKPSVLTMSCWVYPTTLPSTGQSSPMILSGGGYSSGFFINTNGTLQFNYTTTVTPLTNLGSSFIVPTNVWTHLAMVFLSGTIVLYANGAVIGSVNAGGILCSEGGGNLTNLYIGTGRTEAYALAGYIDDVRIHTTALSASEIQALATTPAMSSCSISNDGSYLSVTNSAGGVYELNKNSTGYTLALGNQAGAVNQGSNSIAIGNGAGAVNQSANSIVLNASGSSLNASSSGLYVAPIGTTAGLLMDLLGYGADSQVVKTGIIVAPGGSTRIQNAIELSTNGSGVSNTNQLGSLQFLSSDSYSNSLIASIAAYGTYSGAGTQFGSTLRFSTYSWSIAPAGLIERMRITDVGNVGIGTTNPSNPLHVYKDTQGAIADFQLGSTSSNYLLLRTNGTAGRMYIGMDDSNGNGLFGGGTAYMNWVGTANSTALGFATNNAERMRILEGGNVGIGTTNPKGKLEINAGDGKAHIRITDGANDGSGSTFMYPIASYYARQDGVVRTTDPLTATNGASASIVFTDRPGFSSFPANVRNSDILFYTADNVSSSVLGIYPKERLRITAEGNVGIGTTAPGATLHVQSSSIWLGTFNNPGSTSGGTYSEASRNVINFAGYRDVETNRIGAKICAVNRISPDGWPLQTTDLTFQTTDFTYAENPSVERMVIKGNGNVGIGTTAPGYQLELSTDSAAKPSTNTWTISSDARLKSNIQLADTYRCYDIIKTVPLKRYTWKEEVYTLDQVKDRSKLGWIAQDVKEVFPKAVSSRRFVYNQKYENVVNMNGIMEKKVVSEDVLEDCLDLNADQIYAVMYGAIQQLIKDKESHAEQISSLQTQLAEKSATFEALSSSHHALLAWAQSQGFSP